MLVDIQVREKENEMTTTTTKHRRKKNGIFSLGFLAARSPLTLIGFLTRIFRGIICHCCCALVYCAREKAEQHRKEKMKNNKEKRIANMKNID